MDDVLLIVYFKLLDCNDEVYLPATDSCFTFIVPYVSTLIYKPDAIKEKALLKIYDLKLQNDLSNKKFIEYN